DFLTKYDKQLKNARGAYYTPAAVVKFIVQAVDDILKNDFGIANGLADHSKVEHKEQTFHKVQILDPATGTGTFLAEVVRNIYQKFANNAGAWNDYVHQHLIPRLNGFEIMMSPYTMAHLKIETILQELSSPRPSDAHLHFGEGQGESRLQIYLTDSLENPKKNVNPIPFAQWLSNEATEAAKIKNNVPVMVILGNPPYSGESQNKGEWILRLMEDYKKEPAGGRLQEKNPKWLNDDYAKFIRFGQYFVEKNGEGVLAYINNHSFLDNPTFRGMRYNLLQTFDKIYIIDLHGNAKKKETAHDGGKDENVFDIQQGVSINIFVKTGKKKINSFSNIYYTDLYGKRAEKYNYLLENNLQTIRWKELELSAPNYFFVPKNFSLQQEYELGFKINELFDLNGVGICSKRDETVFKDSKSELINVLNDFKDLSEIEIKQKYKTEIKESRDKKTIFAKQNILKFGIDEKYLQQISYRPFEKKWTYFTNKSKGFLAYPVYEIMQHFVKGKNIGLVVGRQGQVVGQMIWNLVFVVDRISDLNLYYRGGGTVFPLYLYHEHFGQTEKVANLNAAIVSKFPSFGGVPEGRGGRYTGEQPPPAPSKGGEFRNSQNYMQLPYNPNLKTRARELRKAGILSEVLFWNRVKNKQFKGYDFDRQKIVGNYIVDFFCTNCNVVIEIDGSSHDDKQEYDAARDAFLQSVGLTVIHIPDIDIKKKLDDVMEILHGHAALQSFPVLSKGDGTTPSSGHPSKGGELEPEQIFDYIYAVLHSPVYREKYKEFLKIDFPRIPYPKNAEQFEKLVAFGEKLRHLHLMENITVPNNFANFPESGNNKIENSFTEKSNDYQNNKVWINDSQYFDNVPEIAWKFYIGGYQPAQKWLKDRKGRTLTYEEIEHYQKIIFVLNETDRFMKEIEISNFNF
ncbi:MAG: DUF559 domain-containing protein, partial [Dysgonamonadaceae bacterium]|nr:DUF559 domain-containing protein [Dysgonamonadaceae bacterium]